MIEFEGVTKVYEPDVRALMDWLVDKEAPFALAPGEVHRGPVSLHLSQRSDEV